MTYKKFLKTASLLLITLVFFYCKESKKPSYSITDTNVVTPLKIDKDSIKIEGDLGNFKIKKNHFRNN